MARRKKVAAPENHERWLVSYADFITLLFAFFVLMFANSQTDKGKAAQVAESVKKALEQGKMTALVTAVFGGSAADTGKGNAMMMGPGGANKAAMEPKHDRKIVELMPSMKVLSSELKKEIDTGKIQVSMEPRGLAISFKEATIFASGDDSIAPEALESISKVAQAIAKLPNPVRLEGHTDSVPIHTARFRSNWELSAARSIAILELLSGRYGISKDRMAIGGYADTAPIESNEKLEGRAKNRRCDIVILNEAGAIGEPGSHGAAQANPAH